MASTKKTISFVAQQETYDRIKSIFPDSIGREENLIKLLDALENHQAGTNNEIESTLQATITQKDSLIQELYAQIKDLEDSNAKNTVLLEEANSSIESITNINDSLKQEMKVLEEKEIMLNQKINSSYHTIDTHYIIPKSAILDELMKLTTERLSVKYEKQITPAEIFTDMFLRYTFERKAKWFYPFVITEKEIKEIIG